MYGDSKTFVPLAGIAVISLALLATSARYSRVRPSDVTMTSTPLPTMSLPLTPSPTPFLMQDVTANRTCLLASGEDETHPHAAIDALVHLLNSEPLLDFFNNSGTIETLRTALDTAGNMIGPYRSQVIEHDVTGDGVPEILLAITAAIASADYGESHLIMFQCANGAYQEMILFRRAGAGSRAEGLYTGGGAHILSIADLNANGAMDLVFAVDWLDDFGEYTEYYVYEWRDDGFHTIVEYEDALRDTRSFIQSNTIGDIFFVDLDNDGLYELIVDSVPYRWHGQFYTADREAD